MGLTAVQGDLRHLLDLKRDGTSIDIMVLTETKLIPQQHGKLWLKTLFEGWQTHFSSKCLDEGAPKQERSRSGSGGVIVACRKTGPGSAFQRTEDMPQRLAGHFELLKNGKYNLWVVGVYMPCNDQQKRTELYDFLGIVAMEALRSKADLIVAGDWNAVWQSTDKCSGNLSSVDTQHRLALEQMGLCPFQAEHRSKTFGCMLPTGASRIDDVFISSNSRLKPDKGPAEEVLPMGERSDHLPLKITLTLPEASSLSTPPNEHDTPADASTTPLGFARPLNIGQKQMLRCHLEGFQMREVSKIADKVSQVYEEAKALHSCHFCCMEPNQPVSMAARAQFGRALEHKSITKQTVDAMADALTDLISRMNLAALEVLPAMPDPKRRKLFRPRVMGRKYQMLRRERKSLIQQILQKDNVKRSSGSDQCASEAHLEQKGNASPQESYGSKEEAVEQARNRYRDAGQQMKALHHQQMYKARRVQVKKLQQVLHANRKRGHKIIFGGASPTQQLSGVMDKHSGKVVSDKADIKRAVHGYFAGLMKSPEVTDQDVTLPWEERGKRQLDPFDLQQGQNGPATCQHEQDMLSQMDDTCIFTDLLDHLAKGKAAGPDGVPNELLQALPR